MEQKSTFESIVSEITELHEKKNRDYGNAFHDSYEEFGMITAVIRLNDKMNRLKSLVRNGKAEVNESIRDTLIDLAAYAIMTIEELDNV